MDEISNQQRLHKCRSYLAGKNRLPGPKCTVSGDFLILEMFCNLRAHILRLLQCSESLDPECVTHGLTDCSVISCTNVFFFKRINWIFLILFVYRM